MKRPTCFPFRKLARGFTLIEVLLTLAIVSSVLVATHLILASTLSAKSRLEKGLEGASKAEAVLWLLREDLRGALAYQLPSSNFKGSSPQEMAGGAPLLSLMTLSDPRLHKKGSGIFVVSYRLSRTSDVPGQFELLRCEVPWRREPLAKTSYEPVARGIRALELSYSDGSGWQESWSSQALPRGVKISLVLASDVPSEPQEPAERYETEVWIPSSSQEIEGGILESPAP